MTADSIQRLGEAASRLGCTERDAADDLTEIFALFFAAIEDALMQLIEDIPAVIDAVMALIKPRRKPRAPRSTGTHRPAPAPRPCSVYRARAPPTGKSLGF